MFDDLLYIGTEASCAGLLELLADRGIEACATCDKERVVVGQAVVASDGCHVVERLDSIGDAKRGAEMSCKAIAGADRNDTQGGIGPTQSAGDLVDGAVPSDRHDSIEAESGIVSSEFDGMTFVLGEDNVGHPLVVVKQFVNEFRYASFVERARNGVDDKGDILQNN